VSRRLRACLLIVTSTNCFDTCLWPVPFLSMAHHALFALPMFVSGWSFLLLFV
jgi:hypothetical protein